MFLALLAMLQGPMDTPAPSQLAPIASGPFAGSLDSLKGNHYPDWFTDGKLGIWAHWGPQAVPMEGDWYARQMYEPGAGDYKDNIAHRGHPSKSGYKDIIPLWKAEKWDPDHLMDLYKKAGAKYFVSMGVHHDNFDLWNSTYHRWNATKMGPMRDVVGTWAKSARKHGLRFGVSEHLGASWTWFQPSHGADKEGPQAGVPYDGADPAYEDLYHPKALPGDTGWYTTDPRWHREWYRRIKDLVDQYHPDLLYSDGGLPFGTVGESLVAHLYNTSIRNGKQEAVYTCKQPSEGRWAQDVERGVLAGIQPYPWQTDTSIGDWYYNKHWTYRGADWVIHTLIDVVSKNGNLLINVVQRPDGSLDPQAEKVLADMAAWMKTNGESIYGTRPWLVFGEGPVRAKGGAFKEDFAFTAKDVRYVQKGDGTIYATLMGRPGSRDLKLVSLAKGASDTAAIHDVQLLGSKEKLAWKWEADGLHVELPAETGSDIAVVLKISGRDLRGFHSIPVPEAPSVTVDQMGDYHLTADLAETHGDVHTEDRGGQSNLGYWDNATDWVSWPVEFREAGSFDVFATVAVPAATSFTVELGGIKKSVSVSSTGDWDRFAEIPVGRFEAKEGKSTVSVHPNAGAWKPLNLRGLVFRRVR